MESTAIKHLNQNLSQEKNSKSLKMLMDTLNIFGVLEIPGKIIYSQKMPRLSNTWLMIL